MKRRVSTTISAKHYDLLQKYSEQFGSQQKALEQALQTLENRSKPDQVLSREDLLRMQLLRTKFACVVAKDILSEFFRTAYIERFKEFGKSIEYIIERQCHKPMKKLTLKELLDEFILCAKIGNWFDSICYTDEGDHYALKLFHTLGMNNSVVTKFICESIFKEYAAKINCELSGKSIFVKVYKKTRG